MRLSQPALSGWGTATWALWPCWCDRWSRRRVSCVFSDTSRSAWGSAASCFSLVLPAKPWQGRAVAGEWGAPRAAVTATGPWGAAHMLCWGLQAQLPAGAVSLTGDSHPGRDCLHCSKVWEHRASGRAGSISWAVWPLEDRGLFVGRAQAGKRSNEEHGTTVMTDARRNCLLQMATWELSRMERWSL